MSPSKKRLAIVLCGLAAAASLAAGSLAWLAVGTARDIDHHRLKVLSIGASAVPRTAPTAAQRAGLPAPVQRWLAFTFPAGVPALTHVEVDMAGQFRRPKTTRFTPTTAHQTITAATPAMVFDATTPIVAGVWARAYDAYVDGRMEMKAKILSALAVVDEASSSELDRVSLRRWLLESSLVPVALLPGGPVRWEAVDDQRARAVVAFKGTTASLLATFAADGRLLRFDSETDGDLTTPYHGSGEHVARDDYQRIDGVMVPMKFVVARAAGGRLYPFWEGRVTSLRFGHADPAQGLTTQLDARR